jgi:hypothetical protein
MRRNVQQGCYGTYHRSLPEGQLTPVCGRGIELMIDIRYYRLCIRYQARHGTHRRSPSIPETFIRLDRKYPIPNLVNG